MALPRSTQNGLRLRALCALCVSTIFSGFIVAAGFLTWLSRTAGQARSQENEKQKTEMRPFAAAERRPILGAWAARGVAGAYGLVSILTSVTGWPALSRKRTLPCQLFSSLTTLRTRTLTPFSE